MQRIHAENIVEKDNICWNSNPTSCSIHSLVVFTCKTLSLVSAQCFGEKVFAKECCWRSYLGRGPAFLVKRPSYLCLYQNWRWRQENLNFLFSAVGKRGHMNNIFHKNSFLDDTIKGTEQ